MVANVVTGIDSLLNYVNENGEVDATTLSKVLSVNETTLIEWSRALEKAKLIKLVYKMGKMYISPTAEKINISKNPSVNKGSTQIDLATEKMGEDNIKKISEIKSTVINENLEMQRKNIEAINNRLKSFKSYFESTEKYLKENNPEIKNATNELVTYNAEAQKTILSVKSYLDQMNTEIENLRSRDFDFNKKYLSFQNVDVISKNAREIIDDLRSKAAYMRSSMKDLINEFNKKMFDMKVQFSEIEKDLKEKEEQISVFEKTIYSQISSYDEKLEEYKKNQSEVSMKINKERIAVLDKSTKAKEDIQKIYNLSSKRYEEITKNVNSELEKIKEYNTKLTDIQQVDSKIKVIFDEVEGIKKDIIQLQSELKRNTSKKNNKNVLNNYKKILENERKTKDITDRVDNVGQQLSGIGAEPENGDDQQV